MPTLPREISGPDTPTRGQFIAAVAANIPLCREHFKLILRLDSFPPTEPGQFIQVACRNMDADRGARVFNPCLPDQKTWVENPCHEMDWSPGTPLSLEGRELMAPLAMLRRPFSLAGRRDSAAGVELDLIHRVVGIGTEWLAHLVPGDAVNILGPLGNRFALPPAGCQAILVGGGVGIPPMLYLAEKLAGLDAVVFCGALTRDLIPLTIVPGISNPGSDSFDPQPSIAEFARHGVRSVITTDDGSWGYRGFVTQALEGYLAALDPQSSVLIYTCGPEPMMKRVAQIAASHGHECQIAVERAMACGMGTCQSCCIRLKRDPARDGQAFAGKDWIYKLACTDGPVFKGSELLW